MRQETVPWHQLDHMQTICTSLQTDNHTNTSSLNFYRPDALSDAQPTASKHWREMAELVTCTFWRSSELSRVIGANRCVSLAYVALSWTAPPPLPSPPTVRLANAASACSATTVSWTTTNHSCYTHASFITNVQVGWLCSRVARVLDSGAEGPGFKLQPCCCRVTVLGKLFTPIVTLFTKQRIGSSPLKGCKGNCRPGGK